MNRRDAVLEHAADLFAERGMRATTVRDIADAAGIRSGSLYHHFESKEAMVDELLGRFLGDLVARDRIVHRAGGPARRTLERLVEVAFAALPVHRAAIVIYQQEGDRLFALDRFRRLRTVSAEIEQIWLDVIRRGVQDGDFATANPKLAYQFLRDAVWISVRWYRPEGAWTTADLARQFTDTFVAGLRPRGARAAPR